MKNLSYVFLLFLSGCISMTDNEKKENLMKAPSLDKSQKKALDSTMFSRGNWPDKTWWNSFESPLLTSWIEEAFSKNPSLRSVEIQIDQARQIAKVNHAKLFPTLFFDASDNYRYFSENQFYHILNPSLGLPGYEVDLSLAFNYEFDFWSKNRNLFRSAMGEMKAKEAEFYEAQLILSTSLTQAYFAILTTTKKQELYSNLVDVRTMRLELQNQLQNSALISAFPPLLSNENVNEAKQMLLSMNDEIDIQTHLINVLMGRGPDEDLCLDSLPTTPIQRIPLPENLSIELLSRRPDLMAQIWKAEALAAQVGVAKADFFPNINLTLLGGLKSIAWGTLFNSASHALGYKPALSLPIFTAGSIRANVRAKKAAFDQAIFQYNNLLLTSAQEVADLLSQVNMVYSQQDLQAQVVLDAKKRLELTFLRIESGLDSQFSFLDYEEALIEKRINEIDLTYLQYAYLIKLIKSLGGGFVFSQIPISLEQA